MKKSQSDRGFTLIELLVTVAIVGILASMALSLFSEYRGKANDILAVNAINSANVSFNAYLADVGSFQSDSQTSGSSLSINFRPDGVGGVSNGGGGQPAARFLPGYQGTPNVGLSLFAAGARTLFIKASHCRGSARADNGYSSAEFTKVYRFNSGTGKIAVADGVGPNYRVDGSDC